MSFPPRRPLALAFRAFEGAWSMAALVLVFNLPLLYEALVRAHLVAEAYLRFDTPLSLLLLPPAAGLLAARLRRLPRRFDRKRRRLTGALIVFALFASLVAAAGPELGMPLDRLTVVMVMDRSRSLERVPGAEARMRSEAALAEASMREGDRIARVGFAAEAVTEEPARARTTLGVDTRVEVPRDATDLEAALRQALAEIPSDSAARIVLLTDGIETRGDAVGGAAAALAAGVPVDTVVLEAKDHGRPDVRVVSVRAPPYVAEGEAFDLRAVLASTASGDVEVRVTRDGEPLRATRVHLHQGEDVLRLRQTSAGAGLHRYDVAITALDQAQDSTPDDNTGSAFVRVRGGALALVLEGDAGKGAPLAAALRASGFTVVERGASGVPADVGELAGFDLVTLGDIRAIDLATTQVDALASYVRDLGGGLLLLGGDRSMGPGGYARTPLEEVSPVSFDLKQDKRRASLAEVIAIDYSGSMGASVGGSTKLALANEAAARSASLLGPGDRIGVEHVDTTVAWTVPLGPVTDTTALARAIRGVSVGGGGIYTDVALKAGYEALSRESVNLKHLLLFADGDDAEQIAGCRNLVKDAQGRGITTSVISLGRGHDSSELSVLAKVGGGRFYLVDDATKLPAVFSQETILAAKSALHEEPFQVTAGDPSAATRGVDLSSAPPLRGYVVTVPKPRATVALRGPEGDPVLATWSAGLGQAAAFTSDFKDRWGAPWLPWPPAAQLFGQLARELARKEDDPHVRLESDASRGELRVYADVRGDDGRTQSFRRLTLHVAGPDGFARDLPLEARGAGRYAATLSVARPGAYVATAVDGSSGQRVGTTGTFVSGGDEVRPTESDRPLLTRLSAMTGGKARDTLAGLFDDRAARRFAYAPFSALLALAAAAALLLSVAARRLPLPSLHLPRWMDRTRAPASAKGRARPATTGSAVPLAARRARSREPQRDTGSISLPVHPEAGAPVAPGPRTSFGERASTGDVHGPTAAPGPASPPPPRTPAVPGVVPAERALSAAERLAAKRRAKR